MSVTVRKIDPAEVTDDGLLIGRSARLEKESIEALQLIGDDDDRPFNYVLRQACREFAVTHGRMCGQCRRVLTRRGHCPEHTPKNGRKA